MEVGKIDLAPFGVGGNGEFRSVAKSVFQQKTHILIINDHFEEKLIVYLTLKNILGHIQHLVQAMV